MQYSEPRYGGLVWYIHSFENLNLIMSKSHAFLLQNECKVERFERILFVILHKCHSTPPNYRIATTELLKKSIYIVLSQEASFVQI